MKITIREPGENSGYPFTICGWLTDEVARRVTGSTWFEQKHRKNWALTIYLMTNTRLKKPRVHEPKVRLKKEVRYIIIVPYIGSSWTEPARYAQPVRQWLEGIVTVLRKYHFDSSEFEKRIPALLRQFCSEPDRIVPGWVEPAKPKPGGLPKWRIPKNLRERLADADGTWEVERYDPILLTVSDDVSYRGRKIPLMWQLEFDPFDERLESAGERLESRGVEPDGDAWSSVIQKRFKKRFPKLAGELHDDSESSACVLWVESESACKTLLELVWWMLFMK
jgi:hypothetical protein